MTADHQAAPVDVDALPPTQYGDHKPITDPSSPKHVWCDGCSRRWPCEVVRAYRAGREDAAEAVWAKATELGGMPFRSGKVGIQYVNGMEDASEIARGGEAAALHPEGER